MGYADVFGRAYTPMEKPKETDMPAENISPLNAPNGKPPEEPLLFEGFSSGRPLLVEKPSQYVSRMAAAPLALATTIEGAVMDYSFVVPALSLPFVVMSDKVRPLNDEVVKYPLFHFPLSHPLSSDNLLTDQVLALTLVLYDMEAIHEDEDKDLMCYPLPPDFDCADEKWEAALQVAKEFSPVLSTVNLARFALFTLMEPDTERDYFKELAKMWEIEEDAPQLIKEGLDERLFFKETYEDLIDGYEPDPFREFEGTGLLERF